MQVLLCFAVLVAAAAADKGYAYNGRYSGKCGTDGFYDSDDYSFVICSNGNSYKQPCPPGSKNSGAYTKGKYYSAHPFCDVNLVDHGYTVRHGYRNNKGYNNDHYGYNNHGHNDYGYGNRGYGHNQGHGHGNRGYDSYGYGGYNRGYGSNYNSGYGYNSYGHGDRGYRYNDNHYGVTY